MQPFNLLGTPEGPNPRPNQTQVALDSRIFWQRRSSPPQRDRGLRTCPTEPCVSAALDARRPQNLGVCVG